MNIVQRLSHYLERGDLTPAAMLISIAHYGPVLVAHGENVIVAWTVGIMVDLLHFRTVRRMVSGWRWLDVALGAAMTLVSFGYHWRFYGGDWLLAAPLPFGLAVLAYHAATRDDDEAADRDELVSQLAAAMTDHAAAVARLDTVAAERDDIAAQRDALLSRLDGGVVELDKLPTRLADYVTMYAASGPPNGEYTAKHGVGVSTVERFNKAMEG